MAATVTFDDTIKALDAKIAKVSVFHEIDLKLFHEILEELDTTISVFVYDSFSRGIFGGIGSDQFNRTLSSLCARQEMIQTFIECVESQANQPLEGDN